MAVTEGESACERVYLWWPVVGVILYAVYAFLWNVVVTKCIFVKCEFGICPFVMNQYVVG